MVRLLARILSPTLRMLSPAGAAALLTRLAARRARALPPEECARFLMDLDTRLYPLQGEAAVAFGGGIHTKHRHTRYHDFFTGRIRDGETVVDIGCGQGAVAHEIASECGASVTAIDLSEASIATARERHGHPRLSYIVGDALSDLPGESFDVAILSNVLEHIEHRAVFLRRAQERIRPKRWLIRVPLFERDWRVPLKRELGVEWRLDPTHFTEYTLKSFNEEMREARLRVVHLEVRWGEIWSEMVPDEC